MTFTPQNVPMPNRQRSLLAAVMFAILLACVGGAWWLVEVRTEQPERAGQDVLDEIRTQKLSHFWPGKSQRLYYAAHDVHGKTVGWAVISHLRTAEGFHGQRLDSAGTEETWDLDDAATTGTYEGPTGTDGSLTQIQLKDSAATVQRVKAGLVVQRASAPAPANYIPEGLTHVVVRLVAQSGKDGMFTALLNHEALSGRELTFAIVKMKPTGRLVEVETVTQEGSLREKYVLDDGGKVTSIHAAKGSYHLTTVEGLLRVFPKDDRLRQLAREPEYTPAPEDTTAPADEPQEKEVARVH